MEDIIPEQVYEKKYIDVCNIITKDAAEAKIMRESARASA